MRLEYVVTFNRPTGVERRRGCRCVNSGGPDDRLKMRLTADTLGNGSVAVNGSAEILRTGSRVQQELLLYFTVRQNSNMRLDVHGALFFVSGRNVGLRLGHTGTIFLDPDDGAGAPGPRQLWSEHFRAWAWRGNPRRRRLVPRAVKETVKEVMLLAMVASGFLLRI